MNVEEANKRDSITKFSLSAENIVGNYFPEKSSYDLMTGILVCISNKIDTDTESESEMLPNDERKLIGLLKTLFSDELPNHEKKETLHSDYDIKMNENIDRELMDMCNLGYGVYERGIEKGEMRTLLNMVQKKYIKGKSCPEIADELETDLSIIEQIYEVLENAGPDSTEKELLDILMSKNILQDMVH